MPTLVKSYPGEVVAINGTSTGPWAPAPATSFTYHVDVTMDDQVRRLENIKPNCERWPDSLNVSPIAIGTLVTVFTVGTAHVLDARELPHFAPCSQSRPSLSPGQGLIAAVNAMDDAEKAALRKALGL